MKKNQHPITELADYIAPRPMSIGIDGPTKENQDLIRVETDGPVPGDAEALYSIVSSHQEEGESLIETWERVFLGQDWVHVYHYPEEDGEALEIEIIDSRDEDAMEHGESDCESYHCLNHRP